MLPASKSNLRTVGRKEKRKMEKNNIIKEAIWYNPYIAIDTKNNMYKLDNIIIYSDYGVLLETDRGWFGNNNELGDQYIGDINKRVKIIILINGLYCNQLNLTYFIIAIIIFHIRNNFTFFYRSLFFKDFHFFRNNH